MERWLREEEGLGVNTMETQGRRQVEGRQGRLQEFIQRVKLGNGGDRYNNLGTVKPIKPRTYAGERNSTVPFGDLLVGNRSLPMGTRRARSGEPREGNWIEWIWKGHISKYIPIHLLSLYL